MTAGRFYRLRRHVEWIPSAVQRGGSSGRFWFANVGGATRGYVTRLRSGRYEGGAYGSKRFNSPTMQHAARRVVAHINGIYPSQLPR